MAPKLGRVGTVFGHFLWNQLIYPFEKIFVPSSDLYRLNSLEGKLCNFKALGGVQCPKPKMPSILYIYIDNFKKILFENIDLIVSISGPFFRTHDFAFSPFFRRAKKLLVFRTHKQLPGVRGPQLKCNRVFLKALCLCSSSNIGSRSLPVGQRTE